MYDVAIIGTGPAGYTASIYASRYNLSNVIIGQSFGGQTAESTYIENYPSYISIKGADLMGKIREHATHYGIKEIFENVDSVSGKFGDFNIITETGSKINSKSLILALGAKRRKLGVKGENELLGKGVCYCTTCDAPLFKGKTIAVVGGSDAANTSSLYLADIADRVFQIYRGDKLRGEPIWIDQVTKNDKITIIYNTNIVEINGNEKVESITLDKEFNDSNILKLDGLFIEIGSEPVTSLSTMLNLKLNNSGKIIVSPDQKTNVEGIWAAGDITTNSDNFNQVITAAAEGAIAARNVFTYLKQNSIAKV